MRLMFAVFVASLCVLLWAALAIARHIRRQEKLRAVAQDVSDAALLGNVSDAALLGNKDGKAATRR